MHRRDLGRDLDIGRFKIAVADPFLVRGFQRISDLARDRKGFCH